MIVPAFKTVASSSRFSNDLSEVANYLGLAIDKMNECKPSREQFPGNDEWNAAMKAWRETVRKIEAVITEVEEDAMEAGMQHVA